MTWRRQAAALLAVLVTGCAATPPTTPTTSPAPPTTPTVPAPSPTVAATPTCMAEAAALSLTQRIGQLLMVGVGDGLDRTERRAIIDHHVGSVVLLGRQSGGTKAVRALTDRLAKLNPDAALLVAADQEGGTVQRLTGPGFDTIPSAARQARSADSRLREASAGWGAQLARAGVLLNLAPVADVVPTAKARTNQPIGRLGRGYGSDPDIVTAKTAAVIAGLGDAGVAAAVKHFPGLGEVTGNTDHAATVVDTVTTADSPSLQPFRQAAQNGVGAVMIASARYPRIDPDQPAVFSPAVIGLLREWGYDQVVISDDLGVAKAVQKVSAGQRAVRFVAAGGDLVINADPQLTGAMATALAKQAQSDEAFAARIDQAATRVLALKQQLGLVACG